MSITILMGTFLLGVLTGIPIAYSMLLASLTYIFVFGVPLAMVGHRVTYAVNSYTLLAVPLFMFAGYLMNETGVTDRIYGFAKATCGRLRGGLAHMTVIGNLIMAGISGSALADISGLGTIQIKAMKENGYSPAVAAAITAASATIGPIFPPSIPLVIYGAVAEVSVVRLLLGGVIPGLLLTALLCLLIVLISDRKNFPKGDPTSLTEVTNMLLPALPALICPVILIGGLLSGVFGPTEIGAIVAIYGLTLGAVVYRRLTWGGIYQAIWESVRTTASIMFIIGSASVFSWLLTIEDLPLLVSDVLARISENPYVLLLILNLLLFVVGMLMETVAAMLLFIPLLTPPLIAAGVDPVHLGVVFVLNLMIGLLTPPVAMSLYLVADVAQVPAEKVLRELMVFFLPLVAALLCVAFIPGLTLWIPNVFLGRR